MKGIVLFLIAVTIFQTTPAWSEEPSYTFGFVPQQSAKVLLKKWGPILRYVGEKSGYNLKFRTAPKIPIFEKRVRAGGYDFAYMNPVHYTIFAVNPGYRALAKQKGKQIKGIVVVRKDAKIEGLKELAGRTLAFPAPAAFAASVLPRGSLSAQGIDFRAKYVGSHDSVYYGVAKGLYPAGGGIQRTLGTVTPKIRKQLRVLWTTRGHTPHAFAAHPRVPKNVVAALQVAFTGMFRDPVGRELLEAVGFKKGLEAAVDKDWDDVRALGFTKLPK